MASKLRPCTDCNNPLSPTAKECGTCKSTDPFGVRRAEQRFQMFMFLAALVVGLVVFAFWKLGGVTPLDLLHGTFHKPDQG